MFKQLFSLCNPSPPPQATLTVTVVDVNNHAPQFTSPVYHFTVRENDHHGHTGQVAGVVVATDQDQGENGQVSYNVTSRNARGLFSITEVYIYI